MSTTNESPHESLPDQPYGPSPVGDFDLLTPELILQAVEEAYDLRLSGTLTPYNSYINRVYELHDEDETAYMAKFYRPGRWSKEAILEEHSFIFDCLDMEIPTVAPLAASAGHTLSSIEVVETSAGGTGEEPGASEAALPSDSGTEAEHVQEYPLALFPKRGGRNFDAESEEDFLRLGALVGRMHSAARTRGAEHRSYCLPSPIIDQCLRELDENDAVHPVHREEFFALAEEIRSHISPLFEGVPLQRLHGDCHRGNILERPGEGLLLLDFDDMMMGPAIQDLWMLLPGRAEECPQEFNLLAEGYEQFLPFSYEQKKLIEPLRAMRMLYYLAWSARQQNDRKFRAEHPHWGTAAFWSKEIEDLRDQLEYFER